MNRKMCIRDSNKEDKNQCYPQRNQNTDLRVDIPSHFGQRGAGLHIHFAGGDIGRSHCLADAFRNSHSLGTVSYTHLDVYKRQGPYSLLQWTVRSAVVKHTDYCRSL